MAGSLDREDLKEKFSEEDRSKAWRVLAPFRYGVYGCSWSYTAYGHIYNIHQS